MRFSECRHRPVLDTGSAAEIGRVDGFVVDAAMHRIHALRIGKYKGGSILRWDDVQGFGPDAVTIRSQETVRQPGDALDESGDLVGQRVLSDAGFDLGAIDDVEFDPDSGDLQRLILGDRNIDAATLLGAGSYAAVVRQPAGDVASR
ncbi:MAG: PRC-barrel domain-containing protein [Acidimicrobiia bacterium]|nr:PRC-barrel domain-containing protein [Acidimicrobiia bacterium]